MDTQQHYFRVTKPSEEASFGPRIEEYWTIVETKKKLQILTHTQQHG